jgi:hypothetical protein
VHYRFGHQVLLTLLPAGRIVFWAVLLCLLFVLGNGTVPASRPGRGPAGAPAHHHGWPCASCGAGRIIWLALPLEWLFLLLDPCSTPARSSSSPTMEVNENLSEKAGTT